MTSTTTSVVGVVCEAPADQEHACCLADRVLLDTIDWLDKSLMDSVRAWRGLAAPYRFLSWMRVPEEAKARGVKVPHGHFDGQPGSPDAAAARRAIRVFHSLSPPPDFVLMIRDSDGVPARRTGLEQAREASPEPRRLIVGVCHTKRECWVLAGFQSADKGEQSRLESLRQELGFCPVAQSEQLTAAGEQHKRSAKRVAHLLCGDDSLRERSCWLETPLNTLRANGPKNGLAAYLKEIETRLAPALGGHCPKTT